MNNQHDNYEFHRERIEEDLIEELEEYEFEEMPGEVIN